MSQINTAIQIADGMSPALRSMNKSMTMVLNSFRSIQIASNNAFATNTIQTTRQEVVRTEIALNSNVQEIRDADQAQQQLNSNMRNGQGFADGLLNKIKGFATKVGPKVDVKKLMDFSDDMTNITTRLNIMNDGLQTTDDLQNMVFQSAQRSRTAYADTAEVVSNLGINAKDAFSSNGEMVAFAEQMNKQFKIGGASVEDQSSAMNQLTEAMAAGKIEGDDFSTIMSNAPMLAQAMADNMGKSVSELQEMSSEGSITADVLKNALFASAEETNARFAELPTTFSDIRTSLGNTLLQTFEPVIKLIGEGAQWIGENMDIVIPIVYGLAAAAGTYAAVLGIQAAASWVAKVASDGLNLSLLANPAIWIALAIGVLVGMIYKWVQSVGGLEVAWLIVMNAILTTWDSVQIAFFKGIYWVLDLWDKLKLGMVTAGAGILNFMFDMKANVLMILQNMVNSAIDIINSFIDVLNKVSGISIDTINHVTFGTNAQLENEAMKNAIDTELEAYKSEIEAGMVARDNKILLMQYEADAAANARQTEIDAAKAEALAKQNDPAASLSTDQNAEHNSQTAENTAMMADSMDSSEEELKYMRDLAEQEVINRFTTAEIKVEMNNQNKISSNMDIDGIVTHLEDKLYETMVVAAEGVHE